MKSDEWLAGVNLNFDPFENWHYVTFSMLITEPWLFFNVKNYLYSTSNFDLKFVQK
jgi:hypothetical protein